MGPMQHEELSRAIIGCAMIVHRRLGPGFLESVYQNALAWELRSAGLSVECEHRLNVHYRGVVVGEFMADMIVAGVILVENKASAALSRSHEAQVMNYLAATGLEIGLLINFGEDRLAFRRKARASHNYNRLRDNSGYGSDNGG